MATWTPIVTKSTMYKRATSAGDFVFTVHDVDVEVAEGDTVDFSVHPFYYLLNPTTMFFSKPNVSPPGDIPYYNYIRTPFETPQIVYNNKRLKYRASNSSTYAMNYGCPEAFSDTGSLNDGRCMLVPPIFRTPNGYLFARTSLAGDNCNLYHASAIVSKLNTSTEFGYYSNPAYTYNYTYTINVYCEYMAHAIFGEEPEPVIPTDDPYEAGGGASTGGVGGDGNFSTTGDDIAIPGLPTLSASSTGFISLYAPTLSQLNSLSSFMWSSAFDVDTFKKIFADPMDAILGLSIVPVSVPVSGTREVTIGNITTGIYLSAVSSQYVEVNCGSIDINEYWGAYLDYDPYTRFEVYLPYIGTRRLSADDIMGKTVNIVYHIDILSGACVALIKCGTTVLYSFVGQCSASIPVTNLDWTNVINGKISIASSAISAVGAIATGNVGGAINAIGNIASTAVNQSKPDIEKSGVPSSTAGMLGIQTPYLIITRPRQAVPGNQSSYIGYPSWVNTTLSELSGFTIVDSIHLENIPATGAELSEIESLLKSGVIF